MPTYNGDYLFNLNDGVDWARYLCVIDPAPRKAPAEATRQALGDRDTAEHLRRTRPQIERLLGLLTGTPGRPQEPLHRTRPGSVAGHLGGGTDQPQPDQSPWHPDRLSCSPSPPTPGAAKRDRGRRVAGTVRP